ncbi:hypothetical protein E2C01_095081 [Portunus trituberculatus]|uniref:Uncharacterized protein n=1 Tax=Portunus trituberculatus TaxID=210409 RepID=A0A5B7K4U6_PORTR|nr:hypothetical protein [Portunus trituberculatus]
MSGSPFKQKSEVFLGDHTYSEATEGGLGPICQPQIAGLEIENKRPCPGPVHGSSTKDTMHTQSAKTTKEGVDSSQCFSAG